MQLDQTEQQKITAQLPQHLLQAAQEVTGAGITETIRIGLENLTRKQAYDSILELRGSYTFGVDVHDLREDRS